MTSAPDAATSRWPRACQRALLASTAPYPQPLRPTAAEDTAVRHLRLHSLLETARFDRPRHNGTTLPELHQGAIRLFDRGLIALAETNDTHARWAWTNHTAESEGLRLLRWRTTGFLPYNLGYHQRTPHTMSGPEMVAVLVWHHRSSTVRLDLRLHADSNQIHVTEHRAYGTHTTRVVAAQADVTGFDERLRTIHPHLEPTPDKGLSEADESALYTALCGRTAPTLFNETAITIDLNTWRLLPYGTEPATFTDTLPLPVQDALATLSAPTTLPDMEALLGWAITGLEVTFFCHGPAQTWRHRHRLRVDPHTRQATTVAPATASVAERFHADHTMAALRGHRPTCHQATALLEGLAPEPLNRLTQAHRFAPMTVARIEAIAVVATWLQTRT